MAPARPGPTDAPAWTLLEVQRGRKNLQSNDLSLTYVLKIKFTNMLTGYASIKSVNVSQKKYADQFRVNLIAIMY